MIKICSDGGSDGRGTAGAACIVFTEIGPRPFSFFLGEATNNEGEIFSSLVGFAFLKFLKATNPGPVEWLSDSQYALKSASEYIHNWQRNGWKTSQKEPVKNQGLWKTFLAITSQLKFKATHVKGHSGHIDNEACDEAVTWVRHNVEIFDGTWISHPVDIGNEFYPSWYVCDGRPILQEIRDSEQSGLSQEEFLEMLNFPKIDFSLEPKRAQIESNPGKSSSDALGEVKKLTKSYLKKLKAIDPDNAVGLSNQTFACAVEELKKCF